MFEIKFKGDRIVYLELESMDISRDTLKIHFKNVQKLRCTEYGNTVDIDCEGESFILRPGVFEYEVVPDLTVNDEGEVVRLLVDYFYCRYQYKEISALMLENHGIEISARSLKKVFKILNLKRKNVQESPIEVIVEAILTEMRGPGKSIGYKFMWQRLRRNYHLHVKQLTVLKLMRIIDPEGVDARSRYRLKRRTYIVPGPNYLWHVDGFDKLKRYGFSVSGCVDGFSRKVIWMHVATTNNKPQVIANYFLNAVKNQRCVPSLVRSDRGTENCKIQLLQIALRTRHGDENARENSFLKGKSTANERIEKYWKQLRNHTAGYYMDLFKDMELKRELDPSNHLHIAVLRYCFGTLLQTHINNSTLEWNEHRIRPQHNLRVPCGIPNVMYSCPQQYDARDYGHPVNLRGIDALIQSETIEPRLCDQEIKDFMREVYPDTSIPRTVDQARALFKTVIKDINQYS